MARVPSFRALSAVLLGRATDLAFASPFRRALPLRAYICTIDIVQSQELGMPKPRKVGRPRRAGTWVRKNMAMDTRKLALAKEYLGVATETEAVDAALDLIAFQAEVLNGLRAAAASGPWRSPYAK